MSSHKSVILAHGDFPKKGGAAERLLASAKRVIACDGAALPYRRRFGRWPDVVIGDMDSFTPVKGAVKAVKVDDQESNDLAKALDYCAAHRWRDLVIVGATGRREDHAIGNVFRGLAARVPIVTDFGVFHPVCGQARLRCRRGAGVSVFAPDPETHMTSQGLVWPLEGVRFDSLYRATLNRAAASRFTVTSDRPVYVYVET